jgi:hypothetical protein
MKNQNVMLSLWVLVCALLPIGVHARWMDDEPDTQVRLRGFVSGDIQSSDAPLSTSYWQQHALSSTPQTYWWQLQTRVGVQANIGGYLWHIADVRQGQLLADGNAMRLAALSDVGQSASIATDGSYPIHARLWQLKGRTVGTQITQHWPERVTWQWVPELMQVKDYREDSANFQWTQTGTNSILKGSFNRWGTRPFEYLSDERPDAGKAALLHTRLRWDSPYGPVGLSVDNVWSRLDFSNIHYSNTNYTVQAKDNKLQLSNVPSISGSYGMQSMQTQLPRVWQWQWQPAALSQLELGQKGVADQARYYMAYTQPWGWIQFRVETVQAQNWTLGVRSALFNKQLMAALAVTTDAQLHNHKWTGVLLQWQLF